VVAGFFHDNHFVLLRSLPFCSIQVATLGLNIEFGYAGVLNFAGASFFWIGAYTSAVLNTYMPSPTLLVLLIAGCLRAGLVRCFYCRYCAPAATMPRWSPSQFALLLKTFLEVNDVLGGPQACKSRA